MTKTAATKSSRKTQKVKTAQTSHQPEWVNSFLRRAGLPLVDSFDPSDGRHRNELLHVAREYHAKAMDLFDKEIQNAGKNGGHHTAPIINGCKKDFHELTACDGQVLLAELYSFLGWLVEFGADTLVFHRKTDHSRTRN